MTTNELLPWPTRLDVRGHGEVRPHVGWRRKLGVTWESEIGIRSIFCFEPGYNPVRLHFTRRSAERRVRRYELTRRAY